MSEKPLIQLLRPNKGQEEWDILKRILRDFGVNDDFIKNKGSYDVLKEYFLRIMLEYREIKRKQLSSENPKEMLTEIREERKRSDFLRGRMLNKRESVLDRIQQNAEIEYELVRQLFDSMNPEEYEKFINFLKNGKISLGKEEQLEIQIKNGRIIINHMNTRMVYTKKYVIGRVKGRKTHIGVGLQELSSVQDATTGKILSNIFMDIVMSEYDENGEQVSGIKELYHMPSDEPFDVEEYNPETKTYQKKEIEKKSLKSYKKWEKDQRRFYSSDLRSKIKATKSKRKGYKRINDFVINERDD